VGSSDATDGTTHAVIFNLKTKAIIDMGTLGGSVAQANAVNDNNMIVGYSSMPGDSQVNATANTGKTLVSIGNLGGSYAASVAVNDSGTVVGFSNLTGDTDVHAFVWTQANGMVHLNTILPSGSPFLELTSANGIAADGTIVGVGIASDGQPHAFAW
jgi:probable HAF family extracellular repeat protein